MWELAAIMALAGAFGFAMKFSDLVNEHGLRLFPYDAYVFGVLWGILGVLLIMADNAVANVTLAMVLAFIVQMRIDYRNHAIGTVMIIVGFLFAGEVFEPKIFFIFFLSFLLFGLLRAYIGDIRKKSDIWFWVSEPGWAHYYIVPLVWSIATGNWLICAVFATYRTCYNIAKYGLYWAGAYKNL